MAIPDLNQLRTFVVLYELRSLTATAEFLHVTQPTVSYTLARLRERFGDDLFRREGHVMVPTTRATQLFGPLHEALAQIESTVSETASFDPSAFTGELSLGLTSIGEQTFLPPIMARLRDLAPHCRIRTLQVATEAVPAVLESGEADLALGSMHLVPEGLYRQELFRHPFVTLVSARNRDVGDRLSLEQIARMGHVTVTLSDRSEPYDRALETELERHGIRRDVVLSTPHFLVVPLILDRFPDLVATVPRELGTVFARYDAVRVLQPPVDLPAFSLRQHWHPRVHHDEANVWLRRTIKAAFEGYPE